MARPSVVVLGSVVAAWLFAMAAEVGLYFWMPPQPLPLRTIQWLGEVGVSVDSVDRVERLGTGASTLRPNGEFYIVHARVVAPFGLRPTWDDREVEVQTFAGVGGSMHDLRFAVDERAQARLDRVTGRPGPHHRVLGALQHEDLIFDLPRNVEQPAILFAPANDPSGLLAVAFGRFWQPHRFNIRYD